MFENHVFSVSVDTKKWFKAAGRRAVRTVAQAAVAGIGAAAAMGEVDWKYVLSTSALAGFLSILTSVAGIPECKSCEASEQIKVRREDGTQAKEKIGEMETAEKAEEPEETKTAEKAEETEETKKTEEE